MLVARLVTRTGWTIPQIMELTLLQVDELTKGFKVCDELDAVAQDEAMRKAGL